MAKCYIHDTSDASTPPTPTLNATLNMTSVMTLAMVAVTEDQVGNKYIYMYYEVRCDKSDKNETGVSYGWVRGVIYLA